MDLCTRDLGEEWLAYEDQIVLRHHQTKKNQTDGVESPWSCNSLWARSDPRRWTLPGACPGRSAEDDFRLLVQGSISSVMPVRSKSATFRGTHDRPTLRQVVTICAPTVVIGLRICEWEPTTSA